MPLNILHFICHDLGRELACYANPTIPSPNLDAFAGESMRFTRYFAASTPCSPSRGCIMTGKYAHANRLMGLVNRGWDLPASQRTIVDALNDAGYHTANIGLQHERKDRTENRYAYEWTESMDAKAVAVRVGEYLEEVSQPFYINAGTFEVHLRFDQPQYTPDDPDAVQLPSYLPDVPENRLERARFHGAIRYMDEAFATILDALDRTGHTDDTIVVFTTDHGEAFPRAKSTLYDPGIGTTLIIRHPEGKAGVSDALLSNIDLMPTLLEAVGVPVPEEVQGRSFLGLLAGGEYTPRAEIFAEKNYHDHYDPMRCVRTQRYKYIRSFKDMPNLPLPKDILESVMAKALRGDANAPRPREELYDLHDDPGEETNRIDEPALTDVRRDLVARLDAWMRDTKDPLLETTDLPHPPEQYHDGPPRY
jgi:arylsulfatase A-like enzyme